MRRAIASVSFLFIVGAAASGDAAPVHYWQFEGSPGFLEDSIGSATLSESATPGQGAIPGTGPGSTFDALAGNSSLAGLDAGDGFSTPLTASSDFTIEALVNFSALSGSFGSSIAGFFESQLNVDVDWILQARSTGPAVNLVLTAVTTSGVAILDSGFALAINTDYYVAAAYDSTGSVTFWIQNLTSDGLRQSSSVSHALGGGFTATSTFVVGGAPNILSFSGVLDEVRLSDSVLGQDELLSLNEVPEPGTAALVALGLGALSVGRRASRRS